MKSEVRDAGMVQAILDVAPVCIFVARTDGTIVHANGYALSVLGYGADKLNGTALCAVVPDLHLGDLLERVARDGTFADRLDIATRSGEEVQCELDAFSVSNVGGEERLVLILRDISSEIEHAAELEKKNIEMAKMNSELIRSNAQLKRVSEMKSNFLSIASHELKTPLTSIKGYSDIIIDTMEDKLDGGTFRMINSINRAADRLHRVVNNILDVTRIGQKRLRLKPENIVLSAVALDCIDELSQFSQKRGITFACSFAEDLPDFYGDKMRMQQVFINLFSNALKYSPGQTTIRVAIGLEDAEHLRISVRDNGIGINPDEHGKIFHPFYEVGNINRHSTDAAKFLGGGTGLGLSIVKGIVERHGGRIWVESEGAREGDYPGSSFNVVLPVRPAINWDDDESRLGPEANKGLEEGVLTLRESAEDRKPVVLVIDSDREVVEIARMVLESVFDVVVAEDGEKGLRLAFEVKPSLILLDTRLPGLDGYRVCRLLRSQDETRTTPLAFFSAGAQNDDIHKGFVCGADDFIVKPFGGRELVEKIWRLLMRKKERDSLK